MHEPDEPNQNAAQDGNLHYHYDSQTFGPVPREHLARLWQTNSLPHDSFVFDSSKDAWEPASSFFGHLSVAYSCSEPKLPSPESPKIRSTFDPKHSFINSPKKDDRRKPEPPKIRQWQTAFVAASLIAILGICGVYIWSARQLSGEGALKSRIISLEKELAERQATVERLHFSSRLNLAPNEIQGHFKTPAQDGGKTPQIGVKVLLFRKDDIQEYLDNWISKADPSTDPVSLSRDIVNGLPFPIASTTTDSEGFYRFELEESGEFVLHTNIVDPSATPLLWFLLFNSNDPHHGPIDFNESNISNNLTPNLAITPAR